jgi:hypothetical protein
VLLKLNFDRVFLIENICIIAPSSVIHAEFQLAYSLLAENLSGNAGTELYDKSYRQTWSAGVRKSA